MTVLSVGFNDLSALRSVILGYLAYARRTVPPTQQRGAQIRLLEGVYQRLKSVPSDMMEAHIMLQEPEIQALNSAMLVFTAFVRQKVSPSQERDETLYSLENLRLALMQMLPASKV